MAFLAEFEFTPKSDTAVSRDGWVVSSPVETLSGNDIVFGRGISVPFRVLTGVFISSSLDTGPGNDKIIGLGASDESRDGGDGIDGNTIITGGGNDFVMGKGGSGLNGGNGIISGLVGATDAIEIDTGCGNDTVIGIGASGSLGVGGVGIYLISDTSVAGIPEGLGSELFTGEGNDNVIGVGGDKGTSTVTSAISGHGILIDQLSTLNTGSGNDTITGIGSKEGNSYYGYGIRFFNQEGRRGILNTGAGNDTVNAIEGGFGGYGIAKLGTGNDKLMGFGTGYFYGECGKDKLLLGDGVYQLDAGRITLLGDGRTMITNSFETIGGVKGGLFNFADGRLTITGGVATSLV